MLKYSLSSIQILLSRNNIATRPRLDFQLVLQIQILHIGISKLPSRNYLRKPIPKRAIPLGVLPIHGANWKSKEVDYSIDINLEGFIPLIHFESHPYVSGVGVHAEMKVKICNDITIIRLVSLYQKQSYPSLFNSKVRQSFKFNFQTASMNGFL